MNDLTTVTEIPAPPARPADGHKGTFGTVIVVGGAPTMIGAPAICAHAALKAGAGLVMIAASPQVLPHTIAIEPSATGILLENDVDGQLAALDQADPKQDSVLAVGPGMGLGDEAARLVAALLRSRRPIVLDADGLNLMARTAERRPGSAPPMVLTPHPGEFDRLARPLGITGSATDPDERPAAAARLATDHQAVVVLKGRHTVVTDGKRLFVNQTGNPALSTAGSGDVLTGMIASFMVQQMEPFNAAVLGVYVHGAAADDWASRHGPSGLLARDLASGLPDALNRLRPHD